MINHPNPKPTGNILAFYKLASLESELITNYYNLNLKKDVTPLCGLLSTIHQSLKRQ